MKIKQRIKQAILLLLAIAIVFTVTACGGGSGTTSGGGSGDKTDYDQVADLGGYGFTIADRFVGNEMHDDATYAEKVFEEVRRKIEKDYNCTITINDFSLTSGVLSEFQAKVQSGDKVADLIDAYVEGLIPAIRLGLVKNFDDIPGIDPLDARFVSADTNVCNYAGGHYGLQFMVPVEVRNCVIYNRELLKKYCPDVNLPELVRTKQWTFDKWAEILKACTKDTNGDGKTDVYGLATNTKNYFGYGLVAANNARLITADEKGYVKETLDDPNVLYALNYYNDLVNTWRVMDTATSDRSGNAKNFVAGRWVFLQTESWLVNQDIKPIAGDLDYGMVPMPLGPNATEYASSCDNMRVFCVSKTNKDLDKLAYVLNAFGRYTLAHGEGEWWKDYTMFDYFQDGDEESVEMYYYTLEGSCYDLGASISSMRDGFENKIIENVIMKRKSSVAAIVDSLHGTYDEDISAIYNLQVE